jgi:hypothetical protein
MDTGREPEEDETGKGYYLFWALLGGALVMALGSSAILNKMAQRPELADADPLLASILWGARFVAWAGVAVLAIILAVQTAQGLRKS